MKHLIITLSLFFIAGIGDNFSDNPQVKPVQETKVSLPICPKCGEVGCIYEDIDSMTDGTDKSTYDAIIYVGKERKLNDKQLELLFGEYRLN